VDGVDDVSGNRGDGEDEYVVVLECQTRGPQGALDHGLLHAVVEELVEELREWHPAALFSPDRYALQLRVVAERPTEAFRRALELHDRAIHSIGISPPALARVEVLTGREFESQWEDPGPGATTMTESVLSHEIYWATRALVGATTATELTDVLIGFVTSVGGQIQRHPADYADSADPAGEQVSLDFSLDEERLYAVADRFSVTGLILEHSLPTLVADARAVLNRRRLVRPVADELGRPENHWQSSGGGV
jgi:hypothetical protein